MMYRPAESAAGSAEVVETIDFVALRLSGDVIAMSCVTMAENEGRCSGSSFQHARASHTYATQNARQHDQLQLRRS